MLREQSSVFLRQDISRSHLPHIVLMFAGLAAGITGRDKGTGKLISIIRDGDLALKERGQWAKVTSGIIAALQVA